VRKLEQFLFYFLLFAIPFQTRIIFWQQNWNFNEWQSASVYGTDILIFALFLLWAFNYRQAKLNLGRYDYFLFGFLVFSAVSIKNSSSTFLATYNFIKVVEFAVFYFYLKSYAVYRFDLIMSLTAVVAGGVFQSLIAIVQFFKQSSLGLFWFGESVINSTMTGVAVFYNSVGVKIVRAYGTTPHPNVLAAYLFLAMFAFYSAYLYYHLYPHTKREFPLSADELKDSHYGVGVYHSEKSHHPQFNLFLLASYPLVLLAFFFSFARVALFLWFFTFAIRAPVVLCNKKFRKVFSEKANKAKLVKILAIGTIVVLSFGAFYWRDVVTRAKISSNDEAVQLRVFYNNKSLESVNWFGVGNGDFVNWLILKEPNLPRSLYQPVHNIYLLIYSENGILAAGTFIAFLALLVSDFINKTKMSKFYHYSFLFVVLSFFFMGLFDHFLWTLQQGRLMFWLLLAGLAFYSDSSHNLHA